VKDPASGKPLNQGQLKAELGMVLGAGFETTSNAIAWTMGALATHPAVQSQLVSELSAAGLVGPGARQFEWGDVSRLPYLNAVIKESLRLFSPAYLGTSRLAKEDTGLLGYKIPKVSTVWIIPVTCRMQEYYVCSYVKMLSLQSSRTILLACSWITSISGLS
jgi:cytochrome P450